MANMFWKTKEDGCFHQRPGIHVENLNDNSTTKKIPNMSLMAY